MQQRQASVTKTARMFMMSSIIATMTVITAGWVVREFREFQQETQTARQEYIETRQELLKSRVDEAVAYIRYQDRLTEERLRQSTRDRVEEAYSIVAHLYTEYHPTLDDATIQTMIKEALRPIRFNHGRGYYFAVNLNGIEQLFSDQPQLEGQNLLGMQDTHGQYVIQDMIALAKQSGEGFYEYTWTKPNAQGNNFRKIAFIKLFEPYDWIIGTGEYLGDVQADLQQETLQWLVSVRFEQEGYLFGSTYTADSLFTNGQITVGSGNLWDLTDPHGVKIIQEQRKAVEQPEGGFVRYAWKKLTSDVPVPKIAFVKGVSEWQWIIGAGMYIDEIETIIAGQRSLLLQKIFRDILLMFTVCVGLLVGSYGAARYLERKLSRSFEVFTAFFETAATQLTPIAGDSVHFAEFKRLAVSANQMSAERRRMEAALRDHRDQLESLVKERTAELAAERTLLRVLIDNMPDLILVKDTASRFLALNPALAHLMGSSTPDTLLGRTDFDFYPHEIAQQYYALEQEVLITGHPLVNQEELHRDPDTDADRWFLATKIPFRDQQGVIRGLVGISRDITEHKRLEEELRERTAKLEVTNKELQSFAYIVSHDLKAPLRAIAKLAQWLVEDYAGAFDAKGNEMVDLLVGRVQRMDNLIDGILEYSRIGRIVGQNEAIDLNRLLPEVIDSLLPPSAIHIAITPDLPILMGDKTRITQVFQNLIGNAIKFMDQPQGHIAVNCADDGAFWRFSVTDNGPGIDPKYHDKIFQIFQTLKPRDELESTGIGLSIVKKIVEFYGGRIWVESTVGQGSSFIFTYPSIKK
jgi:PAS domain S-box-containing protein